MSAYQKDSLQWQWLQIQQRLGQWWELQLDKFRSTIPGEEIFKWPGWSVSWEIIKLIIMVVFALLIIWLARQIWPYIQPYLRSGEKDSPLSEVTPPVTVNEWWERYRQFKKQGNYYGACRCLYFAALGKLDRDNIVSERSSLTDQEYRGLTWGLENVSAYHTLFTIHQELCFGDREASNLLLEQCEQAYEKI
ncbi:MAG: hypothetical protein N5P05_001845 [Chroococcopsis gigantea SAG 12.99]|jgi:hypothetical protein|nr:DUF4129 domain-containing protein [Chlorogloea purpurea SAG 13.99]MDV3000239.1 hypothetical protein [Chroococcopsis gigantea SAG 12.99]